MQLGKLSPIRYKIFLEKGALSPCSVRWGARDSPHGPAWTLTQAFGPLVNVCCVKYQIEQSLNGSWSRHRVDNLKKDQTGRGRKDKGPKKYRTNWQEDQLVNGQNDWGLNDKGLFDKRTKWSMAELVKDQMLEDEMAKDEMINAGRGQMFLFSSYCSMIYLLPMGWALHSVLSGSQLAKMKK